MGLMMDIHSWMPDESPLVKPPRRAVFVTCGSDAEAGDLRASCQTSVLPNTFTVLVGKNRFGKIWGA